MTLYTHDTLKCKLRYFSFEPQSYINILSIDSNSKIPCCISKDNGYIHKIATKNKHYQLNPMPIKLIKKYMPDSEQIRTHKHLKIFGSLLHNPFLWHFNRKSVSGAFAVGLFCAFIPLPSQMVIAAAIAIMLRVNLPLSVALVWVSNPLTMPPLFYAAYKFGAFLLSEVPHELNFVLSWQWLSSELALIWKPFLLGCFSFGLISAFISYVTIRILWGRHIKKEWLQRKQKRPKKTNSKFH